MIMSDEYFSNHKFNVRVIIRDEMLASDWLILVSDITPEPFDI